MSKFVKHASFEEMMCTLEGIVAKGGSMSFIPAGKSMLPTIRDKKDLVTISPANDIKKYDIVLYRRKNGKYVLHRVVKILNNNSYMMCGDSQFLLEYPVERQYIIGKVSKIKRGKRETDCENLKFFENLYVHLWDLRLILDKGLYILKMKKGF